MSLFDALNTAVAGLSAQEGAMGNISDNIANAQTIGYKSIGTEFDSLVQYDGGFQEPGSVAIHSVYHTDVAGTPTSSQETTSLAVNGNGFFIVKGPPANVGATSDTFNSVDYYTRRGDFTVNNQGYLVNGAGYYLQGYPTGVNGNQTSSTLSPIQVPEAQSVPAATQNMTLVANLPAQSTFGLDTPAQIAAGTYTVPAPVTTTIYDDVGNPQTVTIQFNKTANSTSTTEDTWTADIYSGSSTSGTNLGKLTLQFSNGMGGAQAGSLLSVTGKSGTTKGFSITGVPITGAGTPASVGLNFTFNGKKQAVSLNLGTIGGSIGVNSENSSSNTVDVTTNSQDGYAAGQLSSLSIDDNGFVSLSFSNGQTQRLAQIALAQFAATNDLQSLDGSTFEATTASGAANVGLVGQNGNGQISPGELEQSNVSLSAQLTSLITAQQVYTSNARVVSTADQMLQTLTQTIQG
jgi:flagellar hook protein FlgE